MKKNILAIFIVLILVIVGVIIIKASDKDELKSDINKSNNKIMQTEENNQNSEDLNDNSKSAGTDIPTQVIEPGKTYLVTLNISVKALGDIIPSIEIELFMLVHLTYRSSIITESVRLTFMAFL